MRFLLARLLPGLMALGLALVPGPDGGHGEVAAPAPGTEREAHWNRETIQGTAVLEEPRPTRADEPRRARGLVQKGLGGAPAVRRPAVSLPLGRRADERRAGPWRPDGRRPGQGPVCLNGSANARGKRA